MTICLPVPCFYHQQGRIVWLEIPESAQKIQTPNILASSLWRDAKQCLLLKGFVQSVRSVQSVQSVQSVKKEKTKSG